MDKSLKNYKIILLSLYLLYFAFAVIDFLVLAKIDWRNTFGFIPLALLSEVFGVCSGLTIEIGILCAVTVLQLVIYDMCAKRVLYKIISFCLLEVVKISLCVLNLFDLHLNAFRGNMIVSTMFIVGVIMLSIIFIFEILLLIYSNLQEEKEANCNEYFIVNYCSLFCKFISKYNKLLWTLLYVTFMFLTIVFSCAIMAHGVKDDQIYMMCFSAFGSEILYYRWVLAFSGIWSIFSVITLIQVVLYQANKNSVAKVFWLLNIVEIIKIILVSINIFFFCVIFLFSPPYYLLVMSAVVFILLTILEITMLVHIKTIKKKQNTENHQLELIQQEN